MAALKRLLVLVLLLAAALPAHAAGRPPVIETLSNRADLVSGGDVLVRVTGALRSFTAGSRRVALRQVAPRRWEGLVTGLPVGPTTLTARTADARARLVVTNHPASGPVFAGPQVQPWTCATEDAGLGPAKDRACTVAPVVTWVYKQVGTTFFQPYDPASPPSSALIDTTTTDQGVTVPYLVRVEAGVMDRGLYKIAVVADPSDHVRSWNHKLASPFGGSCHARHQQEPVDTGSNAVSPTLFEVLDDAKLGRGYMVAHNNLGNLGSNCNDVVAAEALMMLKEHIAERYGAIRFTIGYGCSGGSMLQHLIADSYPGLLDGISPACSFPDVWSTALETLDCHLLNPVFDAMPTLTPVQRAAVAGYQTPVSCAFWDVNVADNTGSWFDPTDPANCGDTFTAVPPGVRCVIQDLQVAQLGRRPDGRANRPYDNTGVVYGLRAFEAGTISAEQLVAINEQVGGTDIDLVPTAARSSAELEGVRRAYLGGRITRGEGLSQVAIIDLRGSSNQEIHTDYHSYVVRARLDAANGTHANQVIWSSQPLTVDRESYLQSFVVLDAWLTAVENDHRSLTRAQKVIADKPAKAVDSCWLAGQQITDASVCGPLFPYYGDPRIASGGTLVGGDLKCALKPLSIVGLTAPQVVRMTKVFPLGVCDTSKRSQGYVDSQPWMSYATGDLVPLGPVPVSVGSSSPAPVGQLPSTGLPLWPAALGLVLLVVGRWRRA